MTTARSGDGGVDIRVIDPDPVRGGKLIVQVKRYSSILPSAPVRDLHGTLLHEGAMKGILVTTLTWDKACRSSLWGKPLTLIGGQFTDLLSRYGISHYMVR